jgi:hypothetical protein
MNATDVVGYYLNGEDTTCVGCTRIQYANGYIAVDPHSLDPAGIDPNGLPYRLKDVAPIFGDDEPCGCRICGVPIIE